MKRKPLQALQAFLLAIVLAIVTLVHPASAAQYPALQTSNLIGIDSGVRTIRNVVFSDSTPSSSLRGLRICTNSILAQLVLGSRKNTGEVKFWGANSIGYDDPLNKCKDIIFAPDEYITSISGTYGTAIKPTEEYVHNGAYSLPLRKRTAKRTAILSFEFGTNRRNSYGVFGQPDPSKFSDIKRYHLTVPSSDEFRGFKGSILGAAPVPTGEAIESIALMYRTRLNAAPRKNVTLANKTFTKGQQIAPISLKNAFTDPDGDRLIYTVEGLPPGLEYNKKYERILGTPTAVTSEKNPQVRVTVDDGHDHKVSQTFRITVKSANVAPTPNQIPDQTVTEGRPVSPAISLANAFTDSDKDRLTYQFKNLPDGLEFNAKEKQIEGTPKVGTAGKTFSVIVTVDDGHGHTAEQSFDLTVETVKPLGDQVVTGDLGDLKLATGATKPGETAWYQYAERTAGDAICVDIDTSAAGFTTPPRYFTSLGGAYLHWATYGETSIFNPSKDGFKVCVKLAIGKVNTLTPQMAKDAQWHINWMAIGNR